MGLFDRFKKKSPAEEDGFSRISSISGDPDRWAELNDNELQQAVMIQCITYGVTEDASRIRPLFGFYQYAMERLQPQERMQMVLSLSNLIEQKNGSGALGLMMFMAAEKDFGIISTAAMNLGVLKNPENGDPLHGPNFAITTMMMGTQDPNTRAAIMAGILLLGDKRLLPLLADAWDQISEEARLKLATARSGFVTEALIEFWINCLEKECTEDVVGAVIAALAKMAAISDLPFVADIERAFPSYSDLENPIRRIRQTSFRDYLDEILPRLEAIRKRESEPQLIPTIYAVWEDPEKYRGQIA
jgi:HEAT repeat protein